jgi:hypothetical protein
MKRRQHMLKWVITAAAILTATDAYAQKRGFDINICIPPFCQQPRPYYPPYHPPFYPPPIQPYYYDQGVQYCMQRFRSYDPRTGVYVGYDGRYHRCP